MTSRFTVRTIDKGTEPTCLAQLRRAVQRLLRTAATPTSNGLPEDARVAIEYLEKKLRARVR